MKCNKRKICTNCGATFKMSRGCLLEKRCPPCKFLNDAKSKVLEQFRLIDYEQLSGLNDANFDSVIDIENVVIQEEEKNMLWKLIEDGLINNRQVDIIRSIFEDYTLSEIANNHNISAVRVRQIQTDGIRDMKHPLTLGRSLRMLLDIEQLKQFRL